jgi:hypothetical protein
MKTDTKLQGAIGGDDPVPTSPDPLSPGRTDLNPSDRPGVDELPDNEGAVPLDSEDEAGAQEEMTDVDVDNAELMMRRTRAEFLTRDRCRGISSLLSSCLRTNTKVMECRPDAPLQLLLSN